MTAGLSSTGRLWLIWALASVALLASVAAIAIYGGPRHLLLIGKTTNAHHQIELACNACHTDLFGGREALEASCRGCHQAELDAMDDSHPAKKFRDPRNADRLAQLNAMECLTCHVEHNEDITRPMAVTLPTDFCSACHQDIAEDRPSHQGLAFDTCASAGCHNFHDNSALYEDLLEEHVGDRWLSEQPRLSRAPYILPNFGAPDASGGEALRIVAARVPDAPRGIETKAHISQDWLASAHSQAGVNCSGCHQPTGAKPGAAASWIAKPGMTECAECHAIEANRFVKGKHGMRLASGMLTEYDGLGGIFRERKLSPMRPELARLPMKANAAHRELTCKSCHSAHGFDTRKAQVQSCASCHDDQHTKAYFRSPHYALWQKELKGSAPSGSGVTCATCHMPLTEQKIDGRTLLLADHNQSGNLHPNETMGRGVCLQCHGLEFTLDSLADRKLIDANFKGRPSIHVESLDWVERRMRARGELPETRVKQPANSQ